LYTEKLTPGQPGSGRGRLRAPLVRPPPGNTRYVRRPARRVHRRPHL